MIALKLDADTVDERLSAVFVQVFDLPPDVEPASLQYRGHPKWDSLGHMALVVAIEDEFEVELDAQQLLQIDSFDAAKTVLFDVSADH